MKRTSAYGRSWVFGQLLRWKSTPPEGQGRKEEEKDE
jgi:hypothetical protein